MFLYAKLVMENLLNQPNQESLMKELGAGYGPRRT